MRKIVSTYSNMENKSNEKRRSINRLSSKKYYDNNKTAISERRKTYYKQKKGSQREYQMKCENRDKARKEFQKRMELFEDEVLRGEPTKIEFIYGDKFEYERFGGEAIDRSC